MSEKQRQITDEEKWVKLFSAKVQDCHFQPSQNTLKLAPLESYQKVTLGQPFVQNAEHSLSGFVFSVVTFFLNYL